MEDLTHCKTKLQGVARAVDAATLEQMKDQRLSSGCGAPAAVLVLAPRGNVGSSKSNLRRSRHCAS